MGMNKMLEHIFEKFYAEFIMVNVGDYFETFKTFVHIKNHHNL